MRRDKKNLILESRVLQRDEDIKARSKLNSHVSATLLGLLFVLFISQFYLASLKGILVDGFYRTQWWRSPDPNVVLIAYDDDSSTRYGGLTKLPSEEIARIFDFLGEAKPLAVGVIAPVNEHIYSEAELALMASSMGKVPHTFIGYTDDESLGRNPPAVLAPVARYVPGFISRDTFSYGADSVTRRVMIAIDGLPTLYSRLAALYRGMTPADKFHHVKEYARSRDSTQTYVNWQGPAGTYPLISSQQVAEKRVSPDLFRGKIVLVGTDLRSKRESDYMLSPFSRKPMEMPLLEGAANSLVTLMRDNGVIKSAQWLNFVMAILIGMVTVNMVLYLPPGRGILFVLGEMIFVTGLSWFLLFKMNYWLDLAHPLVVACVGYYLVIPYRLVDEYRKRWHYQEKSELMVQLEQLKSNFLSLISHDLKTPIARIQGNAELVLNEQGKLSENQKKCVTAIVQTTDDLSRYVETVLDLTRIESSQVPIHKASKDINATIVEVVEEKRFLANDKNISIDTKLEPLFSFKFDVKLMRRVLSNLLENAIKYSPPNTTIVMQSREEGTWIRVSVVDQGFGIAPEEQEKVFAKFYRGENPASQGVKGTGLGLYLVKYFVELHQGMIELQSEQGKGSTFTVSLPV